MVLQDLEVTRAIVVVKVLVVLLASMESLALVVKPERLVLPAPFA